MLYNQAELIKKILNNDIFDGNDFEINDDESKVIIRYKYDESGYLFSFIKPKMRDDKGYKFKGSFNPGTYNDVEDFEDYGFIVVNNAIKDWMENLKLELKYKSYFSNDGIDDIYNKCKKSVEEIKSQIDSHNDNSVLSVSEKKSICSKLDEIKRLYSNQLKGIIRNEEEYNKELKQLDSDFSKLKNSIEFMSKNNWAKKLLDKTMEFAKDKDKRQLAFMLLKGSNTILKDYNVSIRLSSGR